MPAALADDAHGSREHRDLVRRRLFRGPAHLEDQRLGPPEAIANRDSTPFRLEAHASRFGGEDLGVVYERFERDGFKRLGDSWGERRRLSGNNYRVACVGDDGWGCRPSRQHPELKIRYIGYLEHGHTFAFSLENYPDLLEGARWATWDANGKLWVAWPGVVARYTRDDLRRGQTVVLARCGPLRAAAG